MARQVQPIRQIRIIVPKAQAPPTAVAWAKGAVPLRPAPALCHRQNRENNAVPAAPPNWQVLNGVAVRLNAPGTSTTHWSSRSHCRSHRRIRRRNRIRPAAASPSGAWRRPASAGTGNGDAHGDKNRFDSAETVIEPARRAGRTPHRSERRARAPGHRLRT